jgi:hypothetical protein
MNPGSWLVGGIAGLAVLFVLFRAARLDDRPPGTRGPLWLLVFSVALGVVSLILFVVSARSGR